MWDEIKGFECGSSDVVDTRLLLFGFDGVTGFATVADLRLKENLGFGAALHVVHSNPSPVCSLARQVIEFGAVDSRK